MNKGSLVSIVICSHNRSADVSECLEALMPQICAEAEVILVDSASDPKNEAEMAKLAILYPAVNLTRVDRPGLSLARNRGVHLAAGDWGVVLDDDAVPVPDWVGKVFRYGGPPAPTPSRLWGGG